MVEAEAAKRGEGTKPAADVGGATSLLDNLDFAVQQGQPSNVANVEATQKAVMDAEKAAAQLKADKELAQKMQSEMNNGTSAPTSMYSNFSSKPAAAPVVPAKAPTPEKTKAAPISRQQSSHEENMAKLKGMTSDFFSDM
eukprot:scaffold43481_cov57-Attheya_sp.AAC.3